MGNLIFVDVESDGPCPGKFSMVCFGAVAFKSMNTFYGKVAPISEDWIPEALAISGISRQEHKAFPTPYHTMLKFRDWLKQQSRDSPTFVSDNPAFDFQWINYYFHTYFGENPFGHSARRIGDLYAGLVGDFSAASKWKKLRRTKHTHNPVDDAMGNVEAFRAFCVQYNVKGIPELAPHTIASE